MPVMGPYLPLRQKHNDGTMEPAFACTQPRRIFWHGSIQLIMGIGQFVSFMNANLCRHLIRRSSFWLKHCKAGEMIKMPTFVIKLSLL